MKKQYIQPRMLVVEMELTGNLMTGSTVEVRNDDFDENNMTPLGRESLWGNEEEKEEESKFWF